MLLPSVDGTAQKRLQDIAGQVKIKTHDGEDAVIDNRSLKNGASISPPADSSYLGCLQSKLNLLSGELESLHELTGSSSVFNPTWDSTFRMQCDVIIEVVDSFAACRPDGLSNASEFNQLNSALKNVRTAAAAAKAFDRGASLERAQYADGLFMRVEPELRAARSALRATAEAQRESASISDLMTRHEIEEFCIRQSSGIAEIKQYCIEIETEAFNALASRSSGSSRVPIGQFNTIRATCTAEAPESYFQRDQCERSLIRRYFSR
jgi:hypothetical protein